MLFLQGVVYNVKNRGFSNRESNRSRSNFAIINYSGGIKRPVFSNFSEKTGAVPYGLDLSNLIDDFQSLRILLSSRSWKSLF